MSHNQTCKENKAILKEHEIICIICGATYKASESKCPKCFYPTLHLTSDIEKLPDVKIAEGKGLNWERMGINRDIANHLIKVWDEKISRDIKYDFLTLYKGESKNGKPNGKGKFSAYHSTDIYYDGEWKDGVPCGKGKFIDHNNTIYDGEWKDGKPEGMGVFIDRYKKSNTYTGNWKNGKPDGKGKAVYDGTIYEGELRRGLPDGKGKLINRDGAICEGIWENGRLLGKNSIVDYNGTVYKGELKSGKPHGFGKEINYRGTVSEGEWRDGKINGKCKMTFSDGLIYDGEWENGNLIKGKKIYYDGSVIEGEWEKGKPKRINFYLRDGSVYDYDREEGVSHEEKILSEHDDCVYIGEWKDGKLLNGKTRYTNQKGYTYNGEWKDGLPNGKGKMIYDGYIYEGEWKNGRKNGKGIEISEFRWIYDGIWRDNKFLRGKRWKHEYSPDCIIECEDKGTTTDIGRITYPNGNIYEGEITGNRPWGKGKMLYYNGDRYEGQFSGCARNGKGKMFYSNGVIQNGIWEYDKLVKKKSNWSPW